MNIILCGLPGCGKTTVGKLLAKRLGLRHIETDLLVKEAYKKRSKKDLSCREIFLKEGERGFRELEKKAVEALFQSLQQKSVISLGGGSLELLETAVLLKKMGTIFYLEADKEALFSRMTKGGVPAYLDSENARASFDKLVQKRAPSYLRACDLKIASTGLSPDEIFQQVVENMKCAAKNDSFLPKLCAIIKGPNLKSAKKQLAEALKNASLIECRFDFFNAKDRKCLLALLKSFPLPTIFTLRSKEQGGAYLESEERRQLQLKELACLKPDYIDLEHTVSASFVQEIKELSPQTQVIISYHDFKKMPPLEAVLKQMEKLNGDLYKMAFSLHTSSEALTLLLFIKRHQKKVIAAGMGKHGLTTRLLSPVFGGLFTFSALDKNCSTAPGQPLIKDLLKTYRFDSLTQQTSIYGLIGDPVEKSLGHICHNAAMHQFKLSSVYCKFLVSQSELSSFLALAKRAGIKGLSVTMPLKEKIIPLLDALDTHAESAGAVNTLAFEEGKITGFNTDGKAALDAIEKRIKVRDKKLVFIGAGGASCAVACEAIKRGARVILLNRDVKRAFKSAKRLDCSGGTLGEIEQLFKEGYDVLINATPHPLPIDPKWILPGAVVMDLTVQPKATLFLQKAKEKGSFLVFGYEMFLNQAVGQFKIWFKEAIDLNAVEKYFQKAVLKTIGG